MPEYLRLFGIPIVTDHFPFAEDVFFKRGTHVMNDHELATWAPVVGDESNMVEATVKDPVDDVAWSPILIDVKVCILGFEEHGHIFNASMVDVRVEFALRVKAHVRSLMFDNEFLEVEADAAIRADNHVRTDPFVPSDVATGIL